MALLAGMRLHGPRRLLVVALRLAVVGFGRGIVPGVRLDVLLVRVRLLLGRRLEAVELDALPSRLVPVRSRQRPVRGYLQAGVDRLEGGREGESNMLDA